MGVENCSGGIRNSVAAIVETYYEDSEKLRE